MQDDTNSKKFEVVQRPRMDRSYSGEVESLLEKEGRFIRVVRPLSSNREPYSIYSDDLRLEPLGSQEENPIPDLFNRGYKLRRVRTTSIVEEKCKEPMEK